jgi:thiamine transport system permease protein
MDRSVDPDRCAIARRGAAAGLLALPVLFLAAFLIYPLTRILALGLGPLWAQGLPGAVRIVSRTGLGSLLASSTLQALASTGLCLALGLPAAYVFARYDFPGKRLLRTLLTIPFVLPTVVVGAGFVALIGPRSPLGRLVGLVFGGALAESGLVRTLPAVLMAHVFYNVSIVVRIVGGFWSNLDPRLRETAEVLGAGRISSFLSVTGRLLLPAVAAAGILVFSFCFTSFGVILILGGPRIGTLETEIYRQAVSFFNLPAAAFLSLVQLAFTALFMLAYSRLQAGMSLTLTQVPAARTAKRPYSPGERILVLFFGYLFTAALLLPLAALAVESFHTGTGFGFSYWKGLFINVRDSIFWSSPFAAAGRSLLFSIIAVLVSLAIGLPASYLITRSSWPAGGGRSAGSAVRRKALGGFFDLLFLLPLGTSAVTLGFGFIVSLDRPPLDLRGSLLIIPIAHALVALPLVTRSLVAPLSSLDPRLREAASVLGAGKNRVRWEIDAPILRQALVTAAAFSFTVSLGEFAATALLTRPELATIPVMIYQYLGQPGDINQGCALAMGTILMIVCGLGLAVIERVRVPGTEVF